MYVVIYMKLLNISTRRRNLIASFASHVPSPLEWNSSSPPVGNCSELRNQLYKFNSFTPLAKKKIEAKHHKSNITITHGQRKGI